MAELAGQSLPTSGICGFNGKIFDHLSLALKRRPVMALYLYSNINQAKTDIINEHCTISYFGWSHTPLIPALKGEKIETPH